MADYKEILRNKAGNLRSLVSKYSEKIEADKLNSLKILIDNTLAFTDGRADALDYDIREEGINKYSTRLDEAIAVFERLEPENER